MASIRFCRVTIFGDMVWAGGSPNCPPFVMSSHDDGDVPRY